MTSCRIARRSFVAGIGSAAVPLLLVLGGCGVESSSGDDPPSNPTSDEQSELVNGTVASETFANNNGLVAVYHWMIEPTIGWNNWWPRPCSGIVLKTVVNTTYVLTARHCVTQNGAINGSPWSPPYSSRVMVKFGAAPGPANPNPPSGAVGASAIWYHTTSGGTGPGDAAIIAVPANWTGLSRRRSIYMGDPAGLVGNTITAFGYGININDTRCGENAGSSGAGTLRYFAGFPIVSGAKGTGGGSDSGYYEFTNNSAGRIVTCGDSGGPDSTTGFPSGLSWPEPTVFGVHSLGVGSPALSTAPGPWVANVMEGLYLSPYSATNKNLYLQFTGTHWLTIANAPTGVGLTYNRSTGRIIWHDDLEGDSYCLDRDTSANAHYFGSCSSTSPYSTFDITSDHRLKLRTLNLCLEHRPDLGDKVETRPCRSSTDPLRTRQTWAFHAAP
jgi:hypothetical protein